MIKKILYLSYDGLTDPLGESQILPYILGISSIKDSKIQIVSVEKKERFNIKSQEIKKILATKNIDWTPLIFSSRFGIISKIWDLFKLIFVGLKIVIFSKIEILHARGHPSAQIGYYLKKYFSYKSKLIFDYRGLWAEERVDKGGWDLENYFHMIQYKYYKKLEKRILSASDRVIVLTRKMANELYRNYEVRPEIITVIPCCADGELFKIRQESLALNKRIELGIDKDAVVFGYLGSVGSMYCMDRFFALVNIANDQGINAFGLIVSNDIDLTKKIKFKFTKEKYLNKVIIVQSQRSEIPTLIQIFDVNVIFLKTSYVRLGTCPTKFAETLMCGVPNVANKGIGDMDKQIQDKNLGMVIDNCEDESLDKVIANLNFLKDLKGLKVRESALEFLDLGLANRLYNKVYRELLS